MKLIRRNYNTALPNEEGITKNRHGVLSMLSLDNTITSL